MCAVIHWSHLHPSLYSWQTEKEQKHYHKRPSMMTRPLITVAAEANRVTSLLVRNVK